MSRLSLYRLHIFLVAVVMAAMAPFAMRSPPPPVTANAFPGWPTEIEGRAVQLLPLTEREAAFARDFPGRIGRFTDGEREIILRWVASPTRRLHPSPDCFRALGYKLATRPMRLAANAQPMSCFRAEGRAGAFEVCEQMQTASGRSDDRSWPDISAWYWHALWSERGTTWWSMVIATPIVNATSATAEVRPAAPPDPGSP
ncbi:MAG: hypothetical protein ACKVP7_18760 [Hyphomicrobiaceae bacterium]